MAIVLGCMSVAILLAEATILPSGVDLSLFSILINAVHNQEVLVQVNLRNYSHSFLLATSKLLSSVTYLLFIKMHFFPGR